MAYLYEDKELVYEKQMRSLKKRIVLVNITIFITNFLATLILIFNKMNFYDYVQLVIPVFILNIVISYAMVINRDSHEQLYLAMYTSIIGTIVVVINIFMVEKNPATYMLLYLAIAIISVYKDKKAVSLGYAIILFYGTIIHFNHTNYIIGLNSMNNNFVPFLYESLLIITLFVQMVRTWINESELDSLYDSLDSQKEVELNYHHLIYNLMQSKNDLIDYTDRYVNEDTKDRLHRFIDLFNSKFYIKEDLYEKMNVYLNLQEHRDPQKVVGKKLGGYQLKKEINQYDTMSTYKQSKFLSLLLSITFSNKKNERINNIKNFDMLFMDPDMTIEIQIIGFILLYDHLRRDKPFAQGLSHDEIVSYFKKREIYESLDEEIVDFFLENDEMFQLAYEHIEEEEYEEIVDEIEQ
jgi:hypothetical protein